MFNKSGDPTSHLVHAEQQVLDWLSWITKYGFYAEGNLPGLMNPVGFVVMGRRQDLNETTKLKLKQRNTVFRGQLCILTYDDLLDKAKNTSRILNGLVGSSENCA